jgi:hypothetical protein
MESRFFKNPIAAARSGLDAAKATLALAGNKSFVDKADNMINAWEKYLPTRSNLMSDNGRPAATSRRDDELQKTPGMTSEQEAPRRPGASF